MFGTRSKHALTKALGRYIPKGYQVAAQDDSLSAVAYVGQTAGKLYGIGYSGKRNKPDWHYRFRSPEECAKQIGSWLDGLRQSKAFKQERRAKRNAAGRGLEVGDIVRASWGYDQTNVDYYQVTALIGSTMVELREIGAESVENGFMSGYCVPMKDQFIGEPMRKVAKDGYVTIDDVRHASKLEAVETPAGKIYRSSYWSSYA